MRPVRRPLIGIAVAALLATLALGASTAMAFHIPGAFYVGTHSDGGAVSFRVSADGSQVIGFRVEDYETEFCDVDFVRHNDGVPIVNNAFSFSSGLLEFAYSGSFPGVQFAQGTYSDTECDTGTLTWAARTSASPAGSAECIAAQAPAVEAETALAAAQTKVKRANGKFRRSIRQTKGAKRAVRRTVKGKRNAGVKRRARQRLAGTVRKRSRANQELRRAKRERTQATTSLTQAQAAKTAVCGPGI
jgi:hypothetical protein